MNQPSTRTARYTHNPVNRPAKNSTSKPSKAKLAMRTLLLPTLSETTPPSGFDSMPARLNKERAPLVATMLRPYSSLRTKGSHAMRV